MKKVTEKNMVGYLVKIENKYRNLDTNTEEFKTSFITSSLLIKRNGRDELYTSPYSFLETVKKSHGVLNIYAKPAEILLNNLNFFRQV